MWWRDAVIYQIYPRSYADSNDDGIGDLQGVISRLDHLAWLGVDAIWMSPVMPSPNADWGYDVADYTDIHPDLGTLDDFDELVREAGERGIRVLNDLVPNHTSSAHPWFVDALAGGDHRDFYVWADPKPDGSPPNNWVSNFGGPAWTLDETSGKYYLHNFLAEQPDLNWWEPRVADAFDDILRFWFDRGVAGFRNDVCHMIVKDAELRDNPPATDEDRGMDRIRGQRQVYNADRPELHDVLKRWRGVASSYEEERLLLGETYVMDLSALRAYYGGDDELQLAFNFPFVHAPFSTERMPGLVDDIERELPATAWPVWTGSNHDVGRFVSHWCDDDEAKARCALMMLLTLRGTPVLYQGDEIGQPHTPLEREQLLDPVGIRFHPYAGRDPGRTPIHWAPDGGFTSPGVETWLPMGDAAACNVADQRDDPTSMLHLCRDLIALRRATPDLLTGRYERLSSPAGTWMFRRGDATLVVVNLSDAATVVRGVRGSVAVATDRGQDGVSVDGELAVDPWSGSVVSLSV